MNTRALVIIGLYGLVTGFGSIESYALDFKDDVRLKENLINDFTAEESRNWKEANEFKTLFAIPDEQLHRVLMDIYHDVAGKKVSVAADSREGIDNRRIIEGVLSWLPVCPSTKTKTFLIDFAANGNEGSQLRSTAILSYLRIADSEETKNALLRFLVEGDRMDSMVRLNLYGYAKMIHDLAPPKKKETILAALIAAAAKEEGKIEFMKVDKILAERSAAYRRSLERLAMLERHSLEPPTTNLYTDRDLKAALAESRTYKAHSAISTNLAALKSRDFNVPQPDLSTNDVAEASPDHPDTPSGTDNTAERNDGTYVFFGLTALLLLGFGAWKLKAR